MRGCLHKIDDWAVGRWLAVLCLTGVVGCRGFDTVVPDQAVWREVQPQIVGMSEREVWRCAGPPLREETAPSGTTTLVYRYADIDNYCEVSLILRRGKIGSFSARHSAPDFFWLMDGSSYCGRIFQGCLRPSAAKR